MNDYLIIKEGTLTAIALAYMRPAASTPKPMQSSKKSVKNASKKCIYLLTFLDVKSALKINVYLTIKEAVITALGFFICTPFDIYIYRVYSPKYALYIYIVVVHMKKLMTI